MNIIRILYQGDQVLPQTSAEAVVVNNKGTVITLDKVLNTKIDEINTDSSLVATKNGTNVVIGHTNQLDPSDKSSIKKLTYDSFGHITSSEEAESHNVVVNDQLYSSYNGNQEDTIKLGDDFKIEDQKIQLNWETISNGNI